MAQNGYVAVPGHHCVNGAIAASPRSFGGGSGAGEIKRPPAGSKKAAAAGGGAGVAAMAFSILGPQLQLLRGLRRHPPRRPGRRRRPAPLAGAAARLQPQGDAQRGLHGRDGGAGRLAVAGGAAGLGGRARDVEREEAELGDGAGARGPGEDAVRERESAALLTRPERGRGREPEKTIASFLSSRRLGLYLLRRRRRRGGRDKSNSCGLFFLIRVLLFARI